MMLLSPRWTAWDACGKEHLSEKTENLRQWIKTREEISVARNFNL